jgi:hypothetical protein
MNSIGVRFAVSPVTGVKTPKPANPVNPSSSNTTQETFAQSSITSTQSHQLKWTSTSSLVGPKAESLAKSVEYSWTQTAATSVAELAARYFSTTEFEALNSGTYHNTEHPLVVAEAAGAFAKGLGWSPERKQFIQQVALLHDADDRQQSGSGEIKTGTPARAQVTLEWMDQQQEALESRFNWSPQQFREAKALIARTDFPFDDKPKNPMGTRYDGKSSLQVYQDLLSELPKETQAQVLKDGLALRFADQAGFYSNTFDQAVEAVSDLSEELKKVGVPTDLAGSLKFTPTFLKDLGTDERWDRQIAESLNLRVDLPTRDTLMQSWEPHKRENFNTNCAQFELLGQALASVPAELVETRLTELKDTSRIVYRMTTGKPPT